LARTEKERDAAVSQVQNLENRLTEVSSFLNGWKNGKQPDSTHRGGRNGLDAAHGASGAPGESSAENGKVSF
jgi:hypothetical protein